MTTMTSTPDAPLALRPGDRLIGVDGARIAGQAVVIDGNRVSADWRAEPIALYLDSHEYVIEREHAPFGRCADCGHRMEADENTCRPCARAEQVRLDAALASAPKRPRKPVTRTFDGLRLVSNGAGDWRTEDGRYEIRKGFDGYTECEARHPVRITAGLLAAARAAGSRNLWAAPILLASAAGKRGYVCEGGTEHQNPDSWQLWDLRLGDYVTEPRHDSFEDAACDLARYLREERADG